MYTNHDNQSFGSGKVYHPCPECGIMVNHKLHVTDHASQFDMCIPCYNAFREKFDRRLEAWSMVYGLCLV